MGSVFAAAPALMLGSAAPSAGGSLAGGASPGGAGGGAGGGESGGAPDGGGFAPPARLLRSAADRSPEVEGPARSPGAGARKPPPLPWDCSPS